MMLGPFTTLDILDITFGITDCHRLSWILDDFCCHFAHPWEVPFTRWELDDYYDPNPDARLGSVEFSENKMRERGRQL